MDYVDVQGIRIAYASTGAGPPLVLLHGSPADSRTWAWVTSDLAKDQTVIAWDAPGYGHSDDIPEEWRAAEYIAALAGFLQSLGVEHPHLVGHSFGSILALSFADRYPAVPASLVLIGAYAGWAGSLPADEVSKRRAAFLAMAELGEAYDPRSYPGYLTDLIPADREADVVTMMRENIRPSTIRSAGHIAAETDLRPVLSTIAAPTLFLHGEADARSPVAAARELCAEIPGCALAVLPQLGHACIVEDPEACAGEIRRFVDGVSGE